MSATESSPRGFRGQPVYLRPYRSVLWDGDKWSLVRVIDGRTEADGFVAIGEAEEWAAEFGYTIVPRP